MLAVQVRQPGSADIHAVEEVPGLSAGPGQVLIDVKAATVNYPDLLIITGRYQSMPKMPFAPGVDAAGIVREIGAGVMRVKPGDRVLIHVDAGAYATEAIAREDQCLPLPDEMSFIDATALGLAAQTAWFALLERGGLQPGDVVLVNGASGAVGQAAVQIASAHGGIVVAAASSVAKARVLLQGCSCSFVSLDASDLRNSLRDQVLMATGNRAADVVIDTLGGDVFDASLRAMAWCGRIVTVGFAAGRIPEIKAGHLLVKNIAALGLQWTDYRDRQPERIARAHDGLAMLWRSGALRPHIMKTLPLHDFAQALRLIESREATGRLVLTME